MCGSRKYPYPLTEGICPMTPPPLQKFQFSSIHCFKFLGLWDSPLLPGISNPFCEGSMDIFWNHKMPVSGFLCHMSWGGPGALSGDPRDFPVQLLACSALLCDNFLLSLLADFGGSLLPLLPPLVYGKYRLGKYSTDYVSVTVPRGYCLQGCHGYLLAVPQYRPAPLTSSIVMSVMVQKYQHDSPSLLPLAVRIFAIIGMFICLIDTVPVC